MTALEVLIPLDGSALSKQVIPYVMRILKPKYHNLTLLRVAVPPKAFTPPLSPVLVVDGMASSTTPRGTVSETVPVYDDQLWEAERSERKMELRSVAEDLRKQGFEVRTEVRFGHPTEEILRFAEDEAMDMICMATHGRSGLLHLMLGSVAEAVMKQGNVPVMMLRPSLKAEAVAASPER